MATFRRRSLAGLGLGGLLAVVLLAPVLGRGVVLVRDMVFVPHIPLGRQLLGLGGVPRAVPSDLLVALGTRVVPVGWLQDVVLVGVVLLGTWGAVRLAPTTSLAGALAAGTVYGWSAFVHERLLLGQWTLLLGAAVLPWATRAALAWRRGEPGWPALAWLAAAALGGANALLLVAVAVVVCGRPVRALVATAVLSVPWALPALLHGVVAGDPHGVSAFAARADVPGGVLLSLLTGGGVWAPAAVPPGRAAGLPVAVAVLALAALGLRRVHARLGGPLLVTGGLGLGLALLGVLPGTSAVLRWAVVHVPAAGLLRDGQKWVALVVLVASASVACGTEAVLARVASEPVRRWAGALVVLAPLAALPGAAWGESGRLQASTLPESWHEVVDEAHGVVLVLPWRSYRAFPWNGDRTVLDPASKLLQRPVVDDDLPLAGGQVQGEDPLAARLDPFVGTGRPLLPALQAEGVAQVLVEKRTRGEDVSATRRRLEGLRLVRENDELALYAVPGSGSAPSEPPLPPVVLADLVVAAFGLVVVVHAVRGRRLPTRAVGDARGGVRAAGGVVARSGHDPQRGGARQQQARDDGDDSGHGRCS